MALVRSASGCTWIVEFASGDVIGKDRHRGFFDFGDHTPSGGVRSLRTRDDPSQEVRPATLPVYSRPCMA